MSTHSSRDDGAHAVVGAPVTGCSSSTTTRCSRRASRWCSTHEPDLTVVGVAGTLEQARAHDRHRRRPTWCCSTTGCPTATASPPSPSCRRCGPSAERRGAHRERRRPRPGGRDRGRRLRLRLQDPQPRRGDLARCAPRRPGEAVISPEMLARLLPRLHRQRPAPGTTSSPSASARCWGCWPTGLSNAAIAERLFVSVHTVRNHVANLSAKLGAHSKLEALSIAVREGLLPGQLSRCARARSGRRVVPRALVQRPRLPLTRSRRRRATLVDVPPLGDPPRRRRPFALGLAPVSGVPRACGPARPSLFRESGPRPQPRTCQDSRHEALHGGAAAKRVAAGDAGLAAGRGRHRGAGAARAGAAGLFAGLALLSQQYEWAERRLEPVKKKALEAAADSVRDLAADRAVRPSSRCCSWPPASSGSGARRPRTGGRSPRTGGSRAAGAPASPRSLSGLIALGMIVYSYRRFHDKAGGHRPDRRRRSEPDRQAGVVLGQPGGAGLARGDPAQLGQLELRRRTGRRWCAASWSSTRRSGCSARPGAARCRSRRRRGAGRPCAAARPRAGASRPTSATARLRPLAPVGGTMCAASPARKSRPCRIGVCTKRAHRQHALLGDRARAASVPAVLAVAEPGGQRRPRSGRRTSRPTSVPLGTWR